jgi:hypothetical protein
LLSLGGCDLAELSAKPPNTDGGTDDQGAPPPGDSGQGGSDLGGAVGDLALASDDGSIPMGAQLGSCDPHTWVATASAMTPINPPAYAIDNLLPSRWTSGVPQASGQYLQVDFGGFVMVDQVSITHIFGVDGKDDYPRGLDVLVSYDGVDYSRKLATASFTTDPGVVAISFPAHAARYMRLQLTQSTTSWFTIHELAVGCQSTVMTDGGTVYMPSGNPPSDPNHASWTGTASVTAMGTGDTVAGAFDGNATTRWSTGKGQYGDEWFRLDIGQAANIREVWLTSNMTDYPSAYELDVSTDDLNYTPVASGLGAQVTKIAFAPQSVRYVRIKQIGTGYNSWWSIYEINIVQ